MGQPQQGQQQYFGGQPSQYPGYFSGRTSGYQSPGGFGTGGYGGYGGFGSPFGFGMFGVGNGNGNYGGQGNGPAQPSQQQPAYQPPYQPYPPAYQQPYMPPYQPPSVPQPPQPYQPPNQQPAPYASEVLPPQQPATKPTGNAGFGPSPFNGAFPSTGQSANSAQGAAGMAIQDYASPQYAAYYYSQAPSTRAFMHAPGNAMLGNYLGQQAGQAFNEFNGMQDPFGSFLNASA